MPKTKLEIGLGKELDEVEQILGKALGYPWYKNDPKNFPNATEEDGVCIGDHTTVTIAQEAANRIKIYEKLIKQSNEKEGEK